MSLAGFPQVLHVIRNNSGKGLSLGMLALWLIGLIFLIIYTVNNTILLVNYLVNLMVVLILTYYRAFKK